MLVVSTEAVGSLCITRNHLDTEAVGSLCIVHSHLDTKAVLDEVIYTHV